MFGLRPDEGDAMRLDDLGELGVFGKETIARVDCVRARNFRRRNDRRDVQIAVLGRRRTDADRLVGQAHMHGVGVGGRMNRDRPDAHFMAGAVDAERDLAAIGDQQLFNAHDRRAPYSITISGWSYSTGWPLSTSTVLTVPDTGAAMAFMTFIASTISTVSPACTCDPTRAKGAAPGSADR